MPSEILDSVRGVAEQIIREDTNYYPPAIIQLLPDKILETSLDARGIIPALDELRWSKEDKLEISMKSEESFRSFIGQQYLSRILDADSWELTPEQYKLVVEINFLNAVIKKIK